MLGPTQSSVTQRAAALLPLDNPSLIYSRLFHKTRSPLPVSGPFAAWRSLAFQHPPLICVLGTQRSIRKLCSMVLVEEAVRHSGHPVSGAISLEQEADRRVSFSPSVRARMCDGVSVNVCESVV